MKHPTSRLLHSYWDRIRGERCAPERAEIEPGEIRHVLADSLILELDMPQRSATLRLAGTRVCALFGRELREQHLAALWGASGDDPWRMIEIVAEDAVGVVAGLRGTTAAGDTIDLELLLLPLRHRGRTQARALGTLSPVGAPVWLGLRPIVRLDTLSLRVMAGGDGAEAGRPGPALALVERIAEPGEPPLDALPAPANDGTPIRRGHLVVHRGGRS